MAPKAEQAPFVETAFIRLNVRGMQANMISPDTLELCVPVKPIRNDLIEAFLDTTSMAGSIEMLEKIGTMVFRASVAQLLSDKIAL